MISLWSLIYTASYWCLVIPCVAHISFPILVKVAMFVRQSRAFYSVFNKVDKTSKHHGGELVAKVLKSHGIENVFTLPGGHVSPISVAAEKLGIRLVDVRHEATAVFAADASARLSGIPGVAVVTAGPGLTNTITAVKNSQMAESPVVIISGAAATMLKGRGSLQDIDQMSVLKSTTKKCFSITTVRDIVPTLRDAFKVSQTDVPGPVFVEIPVDVLYPYSQVEKQFLSMSPGKRASKSLRSRIIQAYTQFSLNYIFAGADQNWDTSPHPVVLKHPSKRDIGKTTELLLKAQRPLIILGSQSVLRPFGPDMVAECINKLGIPVYLNGSARGLLGKGSKIQFRHARRDAVKEADVVLVLGAIADFRLGYGTIFNRASKVISVNRSKAQASLNKGIFWNPFQIVESDVAKFIVDLTGYIEKRKNVTSGDSDKKGLLADQIDTDWLQQLRKRDQDKDESIDKMSKDSTDKYLNPLKVIKKLESVFDDDDRIVVADGGDFVASSSYVVTLNGPCRWLDPGPFGTLGCGAGFALAAKLIHPERKVVLIMGDGAFGYAIPELDTFVRHKLPVYFVIGNDACWTQIAREQVPMLGSIVGCQLDYTNYHEVANGFGAKGYMVNSDEHIDGQEMMEKAREFMVENEKTVVVNALIGKTNFRDGSISI